jgi:peptidoglycan/LPS O-acetylase OafA/YrhL
MNNTTNIKNQNFPQMDGFRGLFCLSIFIIHHQFKYINLPISIGYLGMHGFFILSSFLITRGLLADKPKSKSFKDFFLRFYVKRILRIIPVYVIYILFSIIIALLTHKTDYKQKLGIIYELKNFGWMLASFTYNFKDLYCLFAGKIYYKSHIFAHLWSLSLEEQFYVIVPFMIYYFNTKNLKRLTIIMLFLFPFFRIIGYSWLGTLTSDNMHRSFIIYHTTIFQYDAFFYGTLLALFNFEIKINTLKNILFMLSLLFVFSILINGYIIHLNTKDDFIKIIYKFDFMSRNGQYIYIDILMNILCCLFFYISYKESTSFHFFRNPIFVDIGSRLTYSSYVYQYIFIIPTILFFFPFLLNKLHINRLLAELISASMSIYFLLMLSNISYEYFEKYFIKKKDYLTKLLLSSKK